MPSYEEALREANTTSTSTAADTSTTTANGIGHGTIHNNINLDNRSYRNGEANGSINDVMEGMNDSNMITSMDIMTNGDTTNLQTIHQRDVMNRRQTVQLPIIAGSNDNGDMDDTPTSDNSHSIAEGNSMMPLPVNLLHINIINIAINLYIYTDL